MELTWNQKGKWNWHEFKGRNGIDMKWKGGNGIDMNSKVGGNWHDINRGNGIDIKWNEEMELTWNQQSKGEWNGHEIKKTKGLEFMFNSTQYFILHKRHTKYILDIHTQIIVLNIYRLIISLSYHTLSNMKSSKQREMELAYDQKGKWNWHEIKEEMKLTWNKTRKWNWHEVQKARGNGIDMKSRKRKGSNSCSIQLSISFSTEDTPAFKHFIVDDFKYLTL